MEFVGLEISAKQARALADANERTAIFITIRKRAADGAVVANVGHISEDQIKNLERLGYTTFTNATGVVVHW